MPSIPTIHGILVEHSEDAIRAAEQRMRSALARLGEPAPRKVPQALEVVCTLWGGLDGTKMQRGVRVLPNRESIRIVAALARHPSAQVRGHALYALSYTRELIVEATDAILHALSDVEDVVRIAAARALVYFPVESIGPIADTLRKSFADPVYSLRWVVVRVLAESASASPEELGAVLLASEPKPGRFVDEWLDAARAIAPVPPALEARMAVVQPSADSGR